MPLGATAMWRGWPRLSANTVAQNPAGSVRPALSGGQSAREAHGAHATAATIATAPRAAFSLSIEILEDDNLGAREEASHRRGLLAWARRRNPRAVDRKSTRLNSSHGYISYAVFCLKKKKQNIEHR